MKKDTKKSKAIAYATVLGILVGACAATYLQKRKALTADEILEKVKIAFLEEGPIEGSWIEFKKKPFQKFAIKSHIYMGGITRYEDRELVQYEFIADIHTGTIVDIYRL